MIEKVFYILSMEHEGIIKMITESRQQHGKTLFLENQDMKLYICIIYNFLKICKCGAY